MTDPIAHNFQVILDNVSQVRRELNEVSSSVSSVSADVGSMRSDLASNTADLNKLREDFARYVLVAERTANVQRSETVLGNKEAELERDFGHYKVVRRTSIGTLQAFDIGNVSARTVQQVSEELMLQTPRYWLAPALVALTAWARDDQDLANRSLDAAFSRDARKTALFFALVLRRQQRFDGATRWLRHYLNTLDPRALGREFAVILEAVAQDAFGSHGRAMITAKLSEWNTQFRADVAVVAKQVEAWTGELAIHRGQLQDDVVAPRLSKVSPEWPSVKSSLEHASALGLTHAKYEQIHSCSVPFSLDIVERLDDILEQLVTEYDTDELPYQREVAYHRAVIDSDGDLDRAREVADVLNEAREETFDIVSLQTQTAMRPDVLGVSEETQKVAIGSSTSDFISAVGSYTAAYRSAKPDRVEIQLTANHSNYSQTFGFPGWYVSTADAQPAAEESLRKEWDDTLAVYIEDAKFKEFLYPVVGAIVLAAIVIGVVIGGGVGILFTLLVAGGSAFYLHRERTRAEANVAKAERVRDEAFEFSRDIYRGALAEWTDLELIYTDEDDKERDLTNLLERWPNAGTHAGVVA